MRSIPRSGGATAETARMASASPGMTVEYPQAGRSVARPAVAAVHLLDPAPAAALGERRAEALVRLGHALDARRLRRQHERVEQRRGGEVRDREAAADQVLPVAQLGLQA